MKESRIITIRAFIPCLLILLTASCGKGPRDGDYYLELLTTNDVHGAYFDSTYVRPTQRKSLYAVKRTVDSVRTAVGKDNVILVDAGDCLQGDNAAYYYNYVDTTDVHVYTRMAEYMGYEAIAVGNHDIETGHRVYDRINRELKAVGIPFLAGNAIRDDNGEPYFCEYTVLRKSSLKVAVIGFTNPNIKNWLSHSIWSGMSFKSLIPLVQEEVDRIVAREKPQVVIVLAHSGTGSGDGANLESQGLDLFKELRGVDFLVCSHDHRPFVTSREGLALINSGSHCRYLGDGKIHLKVKDGEVVSKQLEAGLISVDAGNIDTAMAERFRPDFDKVKAFTIKEVGELKRDMYTRDAYRGMSDYINLVHTLQLSCSPAVISFAAPLTYNGHIPAGKLVYNDLFTIYPFENQLCVLRMTGQEIKDYLEYSYDKWICTATKPGDHVLRIVKLDDSRVSQRGWSFAGRSYNFDSAAGINYVVDVTRPYGERVIISSLAGGGPFELDREYPVAMTSYRMSGGGDILRDGAGVDPDTATGRVLEYYPEIRNILYNYLVEFGSIDPEIIGDPQRIGHWEFVPSDFASAAIDADMKLLF